jgi:secondary thiamine-phosphate synthase enzyme
MTHASTTTPQTIGVPSRRRQELIDITDEVAQAVRRSGIDSGFCLVFVPHTTAGVTINENADPSVRRDVLMVLDRMVPDALPYTHGEGNSPAHVKAGLMGSSVQVVISGGRLKLGTWQGIFFCEFDGPRSRKVDISFFRDRP